MNFKQAWGTQTGCIQQIAAWISGKNPLTAFLPVHLQHIDKVGRYWQTAQSEIFAACLHLVTKGVTEEGH